MKLGAFVSDFSEPDILRRLGTGGMGVFLVGDGSYHAVVKDSGAPSRLLELDAKFYVLREDLRSRGFKEDEADKRVRPISYSELVDLIMEEYNKLAWF